MSHRLAVLGWSLGLLMENFLMMKPKLEPSRSCGVSNVGSIPRGMIRRVIGSGDPLIAYSPSTSAVQQATSPTTILTVEGDNAKPGVNA